MALSGRSPTQLRRDSQKKADSTLAPVNKSPGPGSLSSNPPKLYSFYWRWEYYYCPGRGVGLEVAQPAGNSSTHSTATGGPLRGGALDGRPGSPRHQANKRLRSYSAAGLGRRGKVARHEVFAARSLMLRRQMRREGGNFGKEAIGNRHWVLDIPGG